MARKRVERTRPPLYPEHPLSEHQWRLRRARRFMEQDGLDALVLARNVNVFYMSGSRFVFVGMDAPLSLAPQSAAIVTREADIYSQRFGPFDSDEVALDTTVSETLELYDDEMELVNILKDHGIGKGSRVGTEWGPGPCVGINPMKFLAIKERIEKELGAQVVDATPTIWKLMAVKSPLEIERMKMAVGAAARAMERVYQVIEVGMSEVDVARMARQFIIEEGADTVTHAQVMSEADGGMKLLSCDAVDRPIGKGWVHLDMGGRYRRYWSDINRGIFLGRGPTPEEEKLYACRLGVSELMDRIIKPGVPMDDVIAAVKDHVQTRGYVLGEFGGMPFIGHGLGMEPYQQPNLFPSAAQPAFQNAEGKVLFEAGMMFTYEMVTDRPGMPLPFFNIEDNVVVTETGVENMSHEASRELRFRL